MDRYHSGFARPAALCVLMLAFLATPERYAHAQSPSAPEPGRDPVLGTTAILQRVLAAEIPVTGKARKLLVTLSGHVGVASINYLSGPGREALYVFIRSETHRVGDLRFTLPVRLIDRDLGQYALLGSGCEAVIELPEGAEITMTIRAKKVEYLGEKVNALQSEIRVRHVQIDGTEVTQKLEIIPNLLFEHRGHKRKHVRVESTRRERTIDGEKTDTEVRFDLLELRSEDYEGKLGGPLAFKS